MKIIERYAKAVNSSDLRDDERHHSTDVLIAMAMASRMGSLLHRAKHGGDQHSILPLLEAWREMCQARSVKGRWQAVYEEVADISLWHWLDDICRTCHGRKYEVTPDTPVLADIICPDCNGDGRKKLQCDEQIRVLVLDGVQALERMAQEAGRKARENLK